MHGEAARQNLRVKLRQCEHVHLAGLKIGPKDTAILPHRGRYQGQVAKDILPIQLGHPSAAIDETAGDGNAVVVVVFEDALRAGNRVDQARGRSWAVINRRGRTDGAGRLIRPDLIIGHVEQVVPFFDGPAIVAALYDAVDLLNVVLAYVGFDQITRDGVEAIAIGVAKAIGVDLRHLAWRLERVGGRDAVTGR